MTNLVYGLFSLPAVHLLRAGVPEDNASVEIANHYRGQVEDASLFLQGLVRAFAFSNIAQDYGVKLLAVRFDLRYGSFDRKLFTVGAQSVKRAQRSHRTPGNMRLAKVLYVCFVSSSKSVGNKALE